MDRNEALKIAQGNLKAHGKASLDFTMNVWVKMDNITERERLQRELDDSFGYQHGWYSVGEFSFNREMLTGEKYDSTQGGWAFA